MSAIQNAIDYLSAHSANIRECGENPRDKSVDSDTQEWLDEVDTIIHDLKVIDSRIESVSNRIRNDWSFEEDDHSIV